VFDVAVNKDGIILDVSHKDLADTGKGKAGGGCMAGGGIAPSIILILLFAPFGLTLRRLRNMGNTFGIIKGSRKIPEVLRDTRL